MRPESLFKAVRLIESGQTVLVVHRSLIRKLAAQRRSLPKLPVPPGVFIPPSPLLSVLPVNFHKKITSGSVFRSEQINK